MGGGAGAEISNATSSGYAPQDCDAATINSSSLATSVDRSPSQDESHHTTEVGLAAFCATAHPEGWYTSQVFNTVQAAPWWVAAGFICSSSWRTTTLCIHWPGGVFAGVVDLQLTFCSAPWRAFAAGTIDVRVCICACRFHCHLWKTSSRMFAGVFCVAVRRFSFVLCATAWRFSFVLCATSWRLPAVVNDTVWWRRLCANDSVIGA